MFSRLATMPRLPAPTLASALAAVAILALASCGGEDAKLLPGETAREITENLDAVKALAEEGECTGASEAAEEVSLQVEELGDVDVELRQALERGSARLDEVIATCDDTSVEAVEPAEEAPTEEEEPPGQEKKAEKEAEKLEKEEAKEEKEEPASTPDETPPAETPPATPPPSEDGGTGAPGGISPAEPAEPEGE